MKSLKITSFEIVLGRIIVTTDDNKEWTLYDFQGNFAALIMPDRYLEKSAGSFTVHPEETSMMAVYQEKTDQVFKADFLEFSGVIEFDNNGLKQEGFSLLRIRHPLTSDDWIKITSTEIKQGRAVITLENGEVWTIYDFKDFGAAMWAPGEVLGDDDTGDVESDPASQPTA